MNQMTDVGFQIGAAGLGIGAFSGTLDLLHACSKAYGAWRSLKNIDDELQFLRVKLILQQDLLEQWQRDWYGFVINGKSSLQRLRLLKYHDETIAGTLATIKTLIQSLEPLRNIASGGSKFTRLEQLQWLSGQKESSQNRLTEIESLIAGLYRLLPPRIPNVEAAQVVISFEPSSSEQPKNISLALTNMSTSKFSSGTLGLIKLDHSLSTDLQRRVAEFQQSLPAPNLEISVQRIQVEAKDEITVGARSYGQLDQKTPVIIEWKKYDHRWQGQKGIQLRGRIDNLARLLHAETKPQELLTLHCLGYFDNVKESQYGFIFSYPQSFDTKMSSLKVLLDKPSTETLPTLEDRYKIAYSIGLSISILHTADWLHKSIRSQNILFPTQQNREVWSRPYLVGFDFSRPDKPDESSEKPEESARFNLYRHPFTQGSPSENFRKMFDIYSFGVLLLEIGMWRSAWKWWKDGLNATDFQKAMLDLAYGKLAHFMGEEYRDATLKCLNGELEKGDEPILRAFFIEVVEVLGRLI
ncbi:hypothetical protein BGZ60DRAFT_404447 [Tricladium varicosporioides]|nr:hypothetical protein BGZ60DRAFT_404447 [Hymenoscyphus varicosporioides]